jgi:hypothetical protein
VSTPTGVIMPTPVTTTLFFKRRYLLVKNPKSQKTGSRARVRGLLAFWSVLLAAWDGNGEAER